MLTAATTSPSVANMGHGDAPDYGYGDAQPDRRDDDAQPADMGYGDAKPDLRLHDRRSSMSGAQQSQRRASIQAIMADSTKSPMSKRLSVQHLMDGRRNSITTTSPTAVDKGYGDAPDYGYGDARPDLRLHGRRNTMSNSQVTQRRASIAIMSSDKSPLAKRRTIQYITLSLNVRRFDTTASIHSVTSSQGSSSDVDTAGHWCDDLKK